MKHRALVVLLALAVLHLTPLAAHATQAGPPMPWDSGLNNLIDNLSGPTARLLVIGAIVIAGVAWAFTEHGSGGRKLSQLVFGGAIALGAVSLITSLGWTASVL